jgi:CMP-N,N'-diacetyllegionaminic acid synthase
MMMAKKDRLLALIPARGGSKGVIRKNIRIAGGKPLIAWSIAAAKQSIYVDRTIVTTDDSEIRDLSLSFGADVISRPEAISGDKTPMSEVIGHALAELDKLGESYDYLVLLQPTAPLRLRKDIDDAYKLIRQFSAESLISVSVDIDKHPSRCYKLINNFLTPFESEPKGSLRQDLHPLYHRNGAIYITKIDFFRARGILWSEKPLAYVMPKERSINIDDETDLLIADLLLKHQLNLDS